MLNEPSDRHLDAIRHSVQDAITEETHLKDIPELVDVVAELLVKVKLSVEQRDNLIAQIESSQSFKMGLGMELVAKDHKPWLDDRSKSIEWKRWSQYQRYIQKKNSMNATVLASMDKRNSRILDLAGDPQESGTWARKGLVIGDVQSGKTSNYLALFNKAADAGYRVFILLAGDKERLRAQTQERVDEGFIGIDSKFRDQHSEGALNRNYRIGVGSDPDFVPATSPTSYAQDFRIAQSGQIQNINDSNVPFVFVVKKNRHILENLATFLERSGAGPNQKIQAPLLLVDDEADYASIDTSKAEADPTAINRGIRRVLNAFDRSSYVGFTATPFANVLISDENSEDLFPRDFIFSLDSPSNYFGPRQMFDEVSKEENFIVPLQDAEDFFPTKHRKTLSVEGLPQSLQDAILAYYISNTIRDLRPGQKGAPRSMLIHVSRFKDVQRQIFELVNERCAEINSTLELGIGATELFEEFERVFKEHFHYVHETWGSIREQLPDSARTTEVFIVNSEKGNSEWTRAFDGPNPRVIAVGGDVLSRGLTLDGLSISYFYRRSLAYDTVMQMGRWFGYRDGYRDLCKLWIDSEVSCWFLEIAEALDELRSQLEQMHATRETPETYGLAVRCHPGHLLTVTALNKMRSGEKREIRVSLWGKNPETIKFINDRATFASNLHAGENLVCQLNDLKFPRAVERKHSWRGVPQKYISEFFRSYVAPKSELIFGGDEFLKFISNLGEERLSEWDVLLQTGIGSPSNFADIKELRPLQRTFAAGISDPETLIVGMGKSRLGSAGDIKAALSAKGLQEIANRTSPLPPNPSGSDYAYYLERPLLVLYPIEPQSEPRKMGNLKMASPHEYDGLVLGLGVAFPGPEGQEWFNSGPKYMLNSVFQRTNSTLFDWDEAEEYEDD